QRENLSEATRQSSETLGDLADRLKAETEGLRASTSETAGEIASKAGELAGKIERLEQLGDEASDRFEEALTALDRNQQQLTSSVDLTTESFSRAAGTLESTSKRFVNEAGRAVSQMDEGAGKLGARIGELKGATAGGIEKMVTLADKIGQAAGLLGVEAARASGRVNEEMEQLEARFGKGFDQALTLLESANQQALEKSETAASAIAKNADDLLSKAEGFAHSAEAFDHRLAGAIKDEFIRTSSLLIGNLQSMSVDVDRLLETEIPDGVWKKYLAGDKSIFARRAVRLTDKGTLRDIAKRFKEDREFRRYVLKYMQDFESLMENATGETRNNPLSVALLSSELGKLYVLLAQSAQSIS
ncbi:MAG: hypothetical protein V3R73_01435, partial [Sphingomonadales bacterium]